MLEFDFLVLECMCFTMICAFHLNPLPTGTTGQNSHKTQRFHWLVQLVTWNLHFKLWNVRNCMLLGCNLRYSTTITIGCIGRKWLNFACSLLMCRCILGSISLCMGVFCALSLFWVILLLAEYCYLHAWKLVCLVSLVVLELNAWNM